MRNIIVHHLCFLNVLTLYRIWKFNQILFLQSIDIGKVILWVRKTLWIRISIIEKMKTIKLWLLHILRKFIVSIRHFAKNTFSRFSMNLSLKTSCLFNKRNRRAKQIILIKNALEKFLSYWNNSKIESKFIKLQRKENSHAHFGHFSKYVQNILACRKLNK